MKEKKATHLPTRRHFRPTSNMYIRNGEEQEEKRFLSLVEIAFEAGVPFGLRLRCAELLKEFWQRPWRRRPLHLLQRVYQLLRRHITPIHRLFPSRMSLTSLFFTTQGSSTPSQKEKKGKKKQKHEKKKLCEIFPSQAIGASDYANNRARKQILSIDQLSVSLLAPSLPRAQAPLCFHKPWGSIKVSSDYQRKHTHSWMQTNNPQKMDEKSERKNCFFFTIVLVQGFASKVSSDYEGENKHFWNPRNLDEKSERKSRFFFLLLHHHAYQFRAYIQSLM